MPSNKNKSIEGAGTRVSAPLLVYDVLLYFDEGRVIIKQATRLIDKSPAILYNNV